MVTTIYKLSFQAILYFALLLPAGFTTLYGQDLKDLYWLKGHWVQAGMPDTVKAGEVWQLDESGFLHGFGYEMHSNDTIFKEKIRIIKTRDGLYYVVDVNHNPAPVFFILVNSNSNQWVFQNPEHDFPNTIAYSRDHPNSMNCIIEGKGRSRTFSFLRSD
jgi:hypothetical protein